MLKIDQVIKLSNNNEYLVVDKIMLEDIEYGYLINNQNSQTLICEIKNNKLIPIEKEGQIMKLLKIFARTNKK